MTRSSNSDLFVERLGAFTQRTAADGTALIGRYRTASSGTVLCVNAPLHRTSAEEDFFPNFGERVWF